MRHFFSVAGLTAALTTAGAADLRAPVVDADGGGGAAVSGPDLGVLALALQARRCALAAGDVDEAHAGRLTVIDYGLPSTARRMWVIDVPSGEVLFWERVAHGRNTGEDLASSFSNREGSNQSSLGLMRTDDTYIGKNGYSLRLDGLEPGVNDHVRSRAVVVHGAWYAREDFVAEHGRLGRSYGCPALDDAVAREVIDAIKGGTLLFAYYPDPDWLGSSPYLRCEGA